MMNQMKTLTKSVQVFVLSCLMLVISGLAVVDSSLAADAKCYWMENYSGEYNWVDAPQGNVSKEECYALDSCDGGLGQSGGGCYKWATAAKADRIPWFEDNIIHSWGENDRKGTVGQIFKYDNPYNGDTEYFELVNLGSDDRYWYFPTDKTDNDYWHYLGTSIPTTPDNVIHSWGDDDRKGTIGQIFKYDNPYNGDTEYFELVSLGSDSRYWYFPTDKTDNDYWHYLGTES
ncbi:MAG: hypothetical protein SWX82_27190 [Cyanobacteriota bacterium]|nr:hypothetical protein [Cyanobacteriota bacterium]